MALAETADAPPSPHADVTRPPELEALKGVGPAMRARLERLGIRCPADLLLHLPLRYADRTRITPINALAPGMECMVEGMVVSSEIQPGRRPSLGVHVNDGSGTLCLRFYHFSRSQRQRLQPGVRVRCYGQARPGRGPEVEMAHPECRVVNAANPPPLERHLTPIYPVTEGLGQLLLRRLIRQAFTHLRQCDAGLVDHLPPDLPGLGELPSLREALDYMHFPPPGADVRMLAERTHAAVYRLAFEELLSHHLGLLQLRARTHRRPAPAIAADAGAGRAFIEALPYTLTGAQRRSLDDILADLRQGVPMMRLLQGDVGSGKTVVATAAALHVTGAGYQVAVMAPTELLCSQHHRYFREHLKAAGVQVLLLTGRIGIRQRREVLANIRQGRPLVVVGTHALIQKDVDFRRLGLVIIDEQHRFGVHQRLDLLRKGAITEQQPHQLTMTATPIPRTLCMTLYADLDVSRIDELPPGRTPVATSVIAADRRDQLITRIRDACAQGRQVYWVCSLIEDSETPSRQSATAISARLQAELPEVHVGLIHGRMKQEEKERAMQAFLDKTLHLLVATTVIEVGIDVPDASLMVIEDAHRLGLSQLHQLRGRIGRGSRGGDCVLLYQRPLSAAARARLELVRNTTDGFQIAESDLAMRGPGEVLGLRQKGLPKMRIADLSRDRELLPRVQDTARLLARDYPERIPAIIEQWQAHGFHYGEA